MKDRKPQNKEAFRVAQNKSSLPFRRRYLALAATAALIFVLFILGLAHSDYDRPVQHSQTIPGQSDDYRNLNLAVAAHAVYNSPAIKIVKNLGVIGGVDQEIFHFQVPQDHLNESGLLTLPRTQPPTAGFPVIILCHGYVNPIYYTTEKAYVPDMEFYSRNGFAVLKPDFRGQGLSLGQGTPDGAFYSMSYNTDVMSLISAIQHSPSLNHQDINLWGHSMGAYVALRASVLSPVIKNTILLSGPVGTMADMYTSYVASSDVNNAVAAAVKSKALTQHGTPLSNPTFWNAASPLSYLKQAKSFYQVHVGTDDKIVPPHFSADLDAALTAAGKAHQYYVYPGGQHGLIPERSDIYARSLAVLK